MWLYRKTGMGIYTHIEWVDLIDKKDLTKYVYKFRCKRYLYITNMFKFDIDYKETVIEVQTDIRVEPSLKFLEDDEMYEHFEEFGLKNIIAFLFK